MMVDGLPDKYSGILIQQRPAFAGSTYTCSVERDENDEVKLVASPIEETPFPWSELLQHGGLITASWTGEVSNDDTEGMPGTNVTNGRCKFSAIKYRKPDSSSWHVPAFLYDATPETANGGKRKVGNDGFEIWRE